MENPLDDSTAVVAFATDDAASYSIFLWWSSAFAQPETFLFLAFFCWQIGTLVLCRDIYSNDSNKSCKSAEQFLEWSAVFLMVSAECNSPRAVVYD